MEKLKLDIQKFASNEVGILYANGSSSAYGVYKVWFDYGAITRVYNNPSGSISNNVSGPTSATISVSNISNGITTSVTISKTSASHTYSDGTASGTGNFFLAKKTGSSKYTTNGVYVKYSLGPTTNSQYDSGKIRCNSSGSNSAASYVKSLSTDTYDVPTSSGTLWIWVEAAADNSSGSYLRGVSKTFEGVAISNNNASINCTIQYKKSTDSSWTSVSGTSASLTTLSPSTTYNCRAILTNSGDSSKTTTIPGNDFTTPAATPTFVSTPTLTPASESSLTFSSFSANANGGNVKVTINLYNSSRTLVESRDLGAGTSFASGSFIGLSPNSSYYIIVTAQNATYTSYTKSTGEISGTTYAYPYIKSVSSTSITNSGSVNLTVYNPCGRSLKLWADRETNSYEIASNTSSTTGQNITVTLNFTSTNIGNAVGASGTSTYFYYRCTCTTPAQTTTYSTKGTVSLNSTGACPTINDSLKNDYIDYQDVNSTTTNITGNAKSFLGGFSTGQYKIKGNKFPFAARFGASLSEVKITLSGSNTQSTTITNNWSSDVDWKNWYTGSNIVPNTITSVVFTIKATDSRGFSNSYTISVPITKTETPKINIINTARENGYGTTVELTYSGSNIPNLSALFNLNTWEVHWTKVDSNPEESGTDSCIFSSSSGTISLNGIYDTSYSYTFYITIKDKLNQDGISNTFSIPMGEPTMFIDVEQNGVGINCFPNGEGLWLKSGINTISLDKKILDLIYPVGSIFMTTSSNFNTKEKVASHFGGTWEAWGTGRVPVGINASDTAFNTVEKTGGSKTSVAAHTHGFSGTTGDQSANHTHTIPAHAHGLNGHTHGLNQLTLKTYATVKSSSDTTAKQMTGQWRSTKARFPGGSSQDNNGIFKEWEASQATYWSNQGGTDTNTVGWKIDATHEHTGKLDANQSTNGNSGNTADSSVLTSGNQSVNHTHSFSGTTGAASAEQTNGNLQPYIVCYMWKRIA